MSSLRISILFSLPVLNTDNSLPRFGDFKGDIGFGDYVKYFRSNPICGVLIYLLVRLGLKISRLGQPCEPRFKLGILGVNSFKLGLSSEGLVHLVDASDNRFGEYDSGV